LSNVKPEVKIFKKNLQPNILIIIKKTGSVFSGASQVAFTSKKLA